jgi:hypothetical protein
MQNASLRILSTVLPGLLGLSFAACGGSTTVNGPTIQDVTPTVTTNADGSFNVDLAVTFDDSVDTGDLVDAFTFQTIGASTEVDVVDQAIPSSASPITISSINVPMDDSGGGTLSYHLELFGATTGIGSIFDGTLTIASKTPALTHPHDTFGAVIDVSKGTARFVHN